MKKAGNPAWKRRKFLRTTAVAAGSLVSPGLAAAAEACVITPTTEDGPLYPAADFPWTDDLTTVPGQPGTAVGQIAYLFGQVRSADCRPVSDATVEIWQADNKGYYKHPRHPAPDGLDPCFRYFAKVRADREGRYLIKTIVPRWYRIFDIDRAAHVHMKVRSARNGVLTSEIYFSGADQDALRDGDRVFQSRLGKEQLIIDRQSPTAGFGLAVPADAAAAYCRFDAMYKI